MNNAFWRPKSYGSLSVFGEWLKERVMPFIDAFNPDAVTFGGQISGSFQFSANLSRKCAEKEI